jgi:hypothetical protein
MNYWHSTLSHFHYLHYIILLYTITIQLPALSHTNYVLHFLDTFNSSTSHVNFLLHNSSEAPLFSIALCTTPLGF